MQLKLDRNCELALGIILINLLKTNQIDLTGILFGDILGVTGQDVWQTAIILTKLFYKELEFYTFDPIGAKACGLPVRMLHFGLVCGITLTIIASMQTVGVLLVMFLLVGPATTAYLLVKELYQMMILGSAIGVFSIIGGMYCSYYYDLPSGAAIVMIIFSCFILAFLFSPFQGIVNTPRNRAFLISVVRGIFNFNIGGNKYRLIAAIHFNRQKIYIRQILTHAEYDTKNWKND